MKLSMRALIALAAGSVACGSRGDSSHVQTDTARSAPPASGTMPGMPGMGGMQGMQDDSMMAQMESHLQAMQGVGGLSQRAMLPMHRQMAGNMIASMNGQMRQMNMQPDPAWNATVDSLRQDLVRMPAMSATELHAFMPAHTARMRRLMQMHRSMMGGGRE